MATFRSFHHPFEPQEPRKPEEPQAPPKRHPHVLTAAKWIFGFIVFPILFGVLIVAFFLNTATGHNYLLNLLQKQATAALGAGVHLQNFNLHLTNLSVDLYGLKVDGANPHPNPPLLQVQHAQAGVRIVSLFQKKWYLDSIRIDNPVVQIIVDKNGVSNLPTFKSSNSKSNTSVFDLGIRHAVLTNGAVFYNNQPKSLSVDLRDVEFNSTFDNALQKYSGTLAYSNGQINYAGQQEPAHNLSVKFDATPNTFHLSPATIVAGGTQVVLNATVNNYNSPMVDATYNATVDGQQLASALRNPSIPAGLVALSGTAHYQSNPNQTLMQSLAVNGDINSRRLIASTSSVHAEISDLAGHYSLENGNANLRDFRANLLGGQVTAHGRMQQIGTDNARSRFEAALRGISLAQAKRVAGSAASTGTVAIAGTLNATATATWGKTISDLVAHTDASIHASAANAAQSKAGGAPGAPASAVPIEAALHANYTGSNQSIAINNSYLRTPQTNIDLNGAISKNSSLSIRLQATDLREVESIADIFRTPTAPGQSPQQLGLAGTATFNGVVRGSTSAPHLTGQLVAQNLQVHGSSWKLIRSNIDASPSAVNLRNAELDPAAQGHITLNAGLELHKWSFSKTSPIQLQLNAAQLNISDLAKLADQQLPATGTLAANINLRGTMLNPTGNGSVNLTKATAYGEPVNSIKITFNGSGDQAHAKLAIAAPAGTINGNLSTNPRAKTYTAEVTSSGIDIAKLQSVKGSSMNPSGVIAINAKGKGTFDNPQLDATVEVPNLVVQQQKVSDVRLHANVANHVATAQLTSSALNTSIQANAKIGLTGDYPADATLDTKGIPLGPILATYAPAQADAISGETELHGTLHGPLKNKQQLEAHLTIPVLKLNYSNTVQLAATAPIHVDYDHGVINVQRSSIKGTDTDLQFQGSVPTVGNAPMSVLLVGTVNMQLAQLFNPDLRTSGQLKFNINSYGARRDPNVQGTINVIDASFAQADLPVGLQHANGTLTLKKDRLDITSFQGTMGGGTVTAQGGVVLRPAIQFDMGMAAKDVRMLYPQGMREAVDANIRLTGTPTAALLGGNVGLTELSFTRGFDLTSMIGQFSSGVQTPPSQGFTQNLALNLAVHSTSHINLVSRTLSIGGAANLQVRGTAADPVILGRINLTGGDVILNGNRYVLTGGTIQFVNPSITQPVVNLNVTTTIQQYNINLRFEGPVDQMRTQYTSDPALPSADIIHLLAFGQTTEASAMNATPANQAAENLVANQVTSQVTSRISKVAGISQLSINPVLASGTSQGPQGANITIQQRVTGNLFITFSTNVQTTQGQTIQGQYQVTPKVAVSATRDPNGGFAVDTLIKKTW